MNVIAISGTPGTGKTTLARRLSKKTGYRYIGINRIINKYNISKEYDKKRKCKILDVKKLNKALIKEINQHKKTKKINGVIIDSHLSHHLPKNQVDLCIITKCELKVLKNRLKKKGYGKEKIRENIDCEIFDICFNEAKENNHNICVVDTTKIPKGFFGVLKSKISKLTKDINIKSILARIK